MFTIVKQPFNDYTIQQLSKNMQQFIVILIFLSAVGYLGWRAWVSLRRPDQGGCAKGCGCGDTEQLSSLTSPLPENSRV